MKQTERRKRGKIIVLIVLLALFLLVAAFVIWQWDVIRLGVTVLTTDSQTILAEADTKRQEHQKELEKDYSIKIQAPTPEQSEDLLMGRTTPEQVKQELGITAALAPTAQELPAEEKADPQAIVDRYVAELYARKIDLMGQLGEYRDEVYGEWKALPAEERTDRKKQDIVFAALERCYALEDSTDAEIKALLDNCRQELRAIGADESPADTLWKYYEEEKASEKAYYLDKYLK